MKRSHSSSELAGSSGGRSASFLFLNLLLSSFINCVHYVFGTNSIISLS